MSPAIYLAGPDVFLADAPGMARLKIERCARYGLAGLSPFDADAAGVPPAAAIFRRNCELMDAADAGLFNLTPFRGPSADAGTIWEVAYMFGQGKPLFAYAHAEGPYLRRVEQTDGPLSAKDGVLFDRHGHAVEDFDLHDNLMIAEAVEASGGALVVRTGDQGADRLAALEAFDAALLLAARQLGVTGSST